MTWLKKGDLYKIFLCRIPRWVKLVYHVGTGLQQECLLSSFFFSLRLLKQKLLFAGDVVQSWFHQAEAKHRASLLKLRPHNLDLGEVEGRYV